MINQLYQRFGIKSVMAAIMLFFALCFSSYSYLIFTTVNSHSQLGYIINQAGLQRMLTQKLISQTLSGNLDEVAADTQQLLEINTLLVAYRIEHAAMFTENIAGSLDTLYYSESKLLLKRAAQFLEAVKRSSIGEDISPKRLFDDAAALTKLYNEEVDLYQTLYEQRIRKTEIHTFVVTSLVFCGLVMLFFLVLLPFSMRLTDNENQLKHSADVDPLTGLVNRRAFYSKATSIISLCRRQKQRLYALSLDIDHFKEINDTYGHAVGDHVIRHLSNIITQSLRRSDLAARFGGDEFVVLLSNSEDAQAIIKIGDKIRNTIKNQPFLFEDADIIYTVSIGIGEIYDFDLTVDSAIKRSDGALYEAKHRGRDQVVIKSKTEPMADVAATLKDREKA